MTLQDAAGCAVIGNQATTVVTIADNDQPRSALTYSIGGTVSGLLGTGLTLTQLSTDALTIQADGPFAFPDRYLDGVRFDVRVATQPTSPVQACTVTNGSGVLAGADVDDIAVACETLPDSGSRADTTFGVDGKVTAIMPAATDVAVQPDGLIVVVGENRLARFDAAGNPDGSFGANGQVTLNVYGADHDRLQAVAVQPDGYILVAGSTRNGFNSPVQEDFMLARFDSLGALDTSFGTTA